MGYDLWPDFDINESIEENRTLDILREQAKIIKRKTNGRIKYSVSKLEYIYNNTSLVTAVREIQEAFSPYTALSPKREEYLEDELKGKKDINEALKKTAYKFDIYNDYYRFRVLQLLFTIDFPVDVIIDEGICEECHLDKKVSVVSNSEFERILQMVFNSRKMQTIIRRMLSTDIEQKNEKSNEKLVIDIIEKNPQITINELASQLNWSSANTHNRINMMVTKGILTKRIVNGKNEWTVNKDIYIGDKPV